MKKLIVALVSTILLSNPLFAADQAHLARALEMAKICAEHLPDARAAKKALKSQGYRYEGQSGLYHIYSADGFRVLAATTITRSTKQGCLISVSKMTVGEAKKLVKYWINIANAKKATPDGNLAYQWNGTFKGADISIGVIEFLDFGMMKGAAIAALTR